MLPAKVQIVLLRTLSACAQFSAVRSGNSTIAKLSPAIKSSRASHSRHFLPKAVPRQHANGQGDAMRSTGDHLADSFE